MGRKTIGTALAILMIVGPLSAQARRVKPPGRRPAVGIPSSFQFTGWVSNGPARKLTGKALVDHLGARAGAALQYGVKELSVHRFKPAARTKKTGGREITLEVLRMDSSADAFGLFSLGRRSEDEASPSLSVPNVIGPERAAFVKGAAYVEIRAKGCEEADLEKIAASASKRINLPVEPLPAGIIRLPKADLIQGSERYIKGDIAAGAESPLLNREFWGFRAGTSRGYAARYAPDDSKIIVVEFAETPEGLEKSVFSLFREYLEDVQEENGIVAGADVSGGVCLFAVAGKTAVLIIGESDPAVARTRLSDGLAGADGRS